MLVTCIYNGEHTARNTRVPARDDMIAWIAQQSVPGKRPVHVWVDGILLVPEDLRTLLAEVTAARQPLVRESLAADPRQQDKKTAVPAPARIIETFHGKKLIQGLAALCVVAGSLLVCLTPGGLLNKTIPQDCLRYRDRFDYGGLYKELACGERAYFELGNAGPVAGLTLVGIGALGLVCLYAKKEGDATGQ